MYAVNGRPPIATSTRRAASLMVTATGSCLTRSCCACPMEETAIASGANHRAAIAVALLPAQFMRRRAERRGNLEAFPVSGFAHQQLVRLLVVDKRLRASVERELAADAIRNVAEVRQRRGQVAVENAAGQHLRIAGADRIDEVLIVRRFRRRQADR